MSNDPTFTHEGFEYVRIQCPICGVPYCIPYCIDFDMRARPGRAAYCPNGHQWYYTAPAAAEPEKKKSGTILSLVFRAKDAPKEAG